MRVFDFGWAQGERGWGSGGLSQLRLQMHTTDPDYLEQHLGSAMSKGCIRIPRDTDYPSSTDMGFWIPIMSGRWQTGKNYG